MTRLLSVGNCICLSLLGVVTGAPAKYHAFLRPCNNDSPIGQWVYATDDGSGMTTMTFMDKNYNQLNTCLGTVSASACEDGECQDGGEESEGTAGGLRGGAPTRLRLGVVDCNSSGPAAQWKVVPIWSGGGRTYSPALDPSMCITTNTTKGAPLLLMPCKAMPPPQPNGYKDLTQTWYYGPGGFNAAFALAESLPGGGGVTSPSLCITAVGNITGTGQL